MFSVDSARTWVDPSEGEVVGLIASLNQPLVQAAPDRPTEPTQAYIITRKLPSGPFEVVVYFHLLDSNVPVIYSDDEAPFDQDGATQNEEDAKDLVLSMGFLLENRNIEDIPEAERRQAIHDLPPFHEDLSPFAREEEELAEIEPELDEVEEFQRARQAMIESGQADASQFVPEGSVREDMPPLVQGAPVAGAGDVPSRPEIADLDQMEFTGELEAIPDDEGSSLDALLDEVNPAGDSQEPTVTVVSEGEPTNIEATVEPIDDIAPSELGPLDMDELLNEVSKPVEPMVEVLPDVGPASVTILDEGEGELSQPGDPPPEAFVDVEIAADDDIGDGTVDELLDAVEAFQPEPSESGPGDTTMNEILDAVDDLGGTGDDEVDVDDLFAAPDDLIADEPMDVVIDDPSLNMDGGNVEVELDDIEVELGDDLDIDVDIPMADAPDALGAVPDFALAVRDEDLVRLLSLL